MWSELTVRPCSFPKSVSAIHSLRLVSDVIASFNLQVCLLWIREFQGGVSGGMMAGVVVGGHLIDSGIHSGGPVTW